MTKTLLISSFLCSVLTIGCSDKEPGATNPTTNNPSSASDSAEDSGGDTTGNVDPTNTTKTTVATEANPTATESDTTPTTNPQSESGDPSATGDATCGFICDTTAGGGPGTIECDVFSQDCKGANEKCAAWAEGGGSSWNATKCVPVNGDGAPGDSCLTMDGGVSGLDDCGKGAMCWDTDDMMMGTCVELCKGTPDAATCSGGGPCAIVNDGVLNLCLGTCDPLSQDCPNANVCIPLMDSFVCVLDASGPDGGAAYSPCEFANACDPGNFCNDPTLSPMNCDANATGCCIPFCNLDEMTMCPGKNTTCKPYYDEGTAPPMKENIGACIE